MVGGILPAVRRRAVQALQAITLPIYPPRRPILRQPITIITGSAVKIKLFGSAGKIKIQKRCIMLTDQQRQAYVNKFMYIYLQDKNSRYRSYDHVH